MNTTDNQRAAALKIYAATIQNCQRMQPKFALGTAQATLLVNRIAALQVVSALVSGQVPSLAQMTASVAPIQSILHKTIVARAKYAPETAIYRRLTPMIAAMTLGLSVLQTALAQSQTNQGATADD
ncbi:MAG: hypothetical protein LKJ29_05790 [Lactobacillus sp.]|jgi:hypothetical protein|uniref:Uncharacterized protein n=1 Tax=Lacticaseibacillus suilingensis TaxID=2799577 RepID=A0ABW4BEF6_9LACO|nr:hypothetical protein [Lacticaseibacillus suilingensis]MCI1894231.1 hypothetical protein [Lactobacillus sp.]MCI1917105.1 hypothetical protein [Lactobacillus sp.]MCI1941545.1 hypothetical protein [Lactobacillus sp.]MCI1972091.1 hypothetical protein [Lactobacillus sp.]MCI2016960.1 hypothetical protein [Lactobacillus sp.]